MPQDNSSDVAESTIDFATLLEQSFAENALARGDFVTGSVLAVDHQGLIVGVGTCFDGFVSRKDIERMGDQPEDYEIGQEITAYVLRESDEEGNYTLSISQARQFEDWKLAEKLQQDDEVWEGEVIDSNRGGLILGFSHLRGFVPAGHVADLPRGLDEEQRIALLRKYIGSRIKVKVLEADRKQRRLVFSQREAQRQKRQALREELLQELKEGDVRKGVVNGLRDFGAFVDLGGADGLIHISELAWNRVKHPSEVLNVGDEVEVYVLSLDEGGNRIGLSRKRLQPNPWDSVEELYHIGQLVEGTVSRTAKFGAFVTLEPGIEALLHISQISDSGQDDATNLMIEGQRLLMRIVSIEAESQRLGLSLKEVTADEKLSWAESSNNGTIPEIMVDNAVAELLD